MFVVPITQTEQMFSMSTINKYTWYAGALLVFALVCDVALSTSKYPLFTLIVCGIVVILAYVSPHIRKSY
jgi:hypothetical protein